MFEAVNQQFKAIQELERCHFRWLSLPPIHVDTNVFWSRRMLGIFGTVISPGRTAGASLKQAFGIVFDFFKFRSSPVEMPGPH